MSAIASFYLMTKTKLDNYFKMAGMVPKGTIKRADNVHAAAVLHVVPAEEMKSPKFVNEQKHYHELWEFLHKNSTQPFRYEWSGWVMYELICCLKESDNIDLLTNAYESKGGGDERWLFDIKTKNRYFKKLAPTNFSEHKLIFEYEHYKEQQYPKTPLPNWILPKYKSSDFPEAGKALSDGIRVIHNYLNLINDDQTVVLVNIG